MHSCLKSNTKAVFFRRSDYSIDYRIAYSLDPERFPRRPSHRYIGFLKTRLFCIQTLVHHHVYQDYHHLIMSLIARVLRSGVDIMARVTGTCWGTCSASVLVILMATTLLIGGTSAGEVMEYCERETFRASCDGDHVIMMTSAIYGIMRLGRCVTVDFGFLGSAEDVLPQVHAMCSGRRECEFLISELHKFGGCAPGLICYLEASYECVPVTRCSMSQCRSGSFLKVPATSGYIGAVTTQETGCGSEVCPWMIKPDEGQSVNFTFYYFASDSDQQGSAAGGGAVVGPRCQKHAVVLDKGTKVIKDMLSCEGSPAVSWYVTSESSEAELRVYTGRAEAPFHTVVKYEVVGCPTLRPPEGATVSRQGDTLSVSCRASARSWHLTCDRNAWVGEVGQCEEWDIDPAPLDPTPQGLAMVVGIGVVLGVVLGFSLLGLAVFCMRRHRRNHYQRPDDIIRYPPEADKSYEVKIYGQGAVTTAAGPASAAKGGQLMSDAGYYTDTSYQIRQPPPPVFGTGSAQQFVTSPKLMTTSPGQHAPLPPPQTTYFQSIGSGEVPYNFRDHVYESPHFKQEDAHSNTSN